MPTTFAEVRARFVAVISALVPRRMASERFQHFVWEMDFVEAAADENNRAALLRKFYLTDSHDDAPTGYTDQHTVRVSHSFTLDVAYPKLLGKFGAERSSELDDLIREDFHQIDRAIGIVGAINWPDGLHLCDHQGGTLVNAGPTLIRRCIYQVTYDKELNP